MCRGRLIDVPFYTRGTAQNLRCVQGPHPTEVVQNQSFVQGKKENAKRRGRLIDIPRPRGKNHTERFCNSISAGTIKIDILDGRYIEIHLLSGLSARMHQRSFIDTQKRTGLPVRFCVFITRFHWKLSHKRKPHKKRFNLAKRGIYARRLLLWKRYPPPKRWGTSQRGYIFSLFVNFLRNFFCYIINFYYFLCNFCFNRLTARYI